MVDRFRICEEKISTLGTKVVDIHRLCIECSLARGLRREWEGFLSGCSPSKGWYARAVDLHCSVDIGWENVRILDSP